MKQGILPITQRGRREARRSTGLNRRAWKVWHKSKPDETVTTISCDNGDARRAALTYFVQKDATAKFIDLRAKRSPDDDV